MPLAGAGGALVTGVIPYGRAASWVDDAPHGWLDQAATQKGHCVPHALVMLIDGNEIGARSSFGFHEFANYPSKGDHILLPTENRRHLIVRVSIVEHRPVGVKGMIQPTVTLYTEFVGWDDV